MTRVRVLTAAVLIPAVVAIVWWGSTGLVAAITALATLLALLEFLALGERLGMRGFRIWTCSCALLFAFHQWGVARGYGLYPRSPVNPYGSPVDFAELAVSTEFVLLIFVLGCAGIVFAGRRPLAEVLPAIGVNAAALVFVALPLSFVVVLHRAAFPEGRKLLLFLLVMIWVGDSAAYFVGRAFGRTPMASQISPKKTWEGAAANLAGSLATAAAFTKWMGVPLVVLLGAAAFGNLAGQVGDLAESAYKRSARVKDSGAILPGHGGMLDRIDALIFAAPVVWYYFHLQVAHIFAR